MVSSHNMKTKRKQLDVPLLRNRQEALTNPFPSNVSFLGERVIPPHFAEGNEDNSAANDSVPELVVKAASTPSWGVEEVVTLPQPLECLPQLVDVPLIDFWV